MKNRDLTIPELRIVHEYLVKKTVEEINCLHDHLDFHFIDKYLSLLREVNKDLDIAIAITIQEDEIVNQLHPDTFNSVDDCPF